MSYPKLTHAFTSTIGTYCSSELSVSQEEEVVAVLLSYTNKLAMANT